MKKNDLLAYRHIGISEKRRGEDAPKIGVKSLDELIDKTIPANIRLKEPLALPKTMTEYEFGQHIAGLAAKTNSTQPISVWDGTTPSLLPLSNRNVFENPRLVHFLYPLSDRSLTRTPGSLDELPDCRMRPHRHAPCQLLPAGRSDCRSRSRDDDVCPASARHAEIGRQRGIC